MRILARKSFGAVLSGFAALAAVEAVLLAFPSTAFLALTVFLGVFLTVAFLVFLRVVSKC
jgi:hypothetical protein